MEHTLELTIRINGDTAEVEVREPESRDCARIEAPFSPDEHPEFDQAIGNELYSWISLWKEAEDEDAANEDAD